MHPKKNSATAPTFTFTALACFALVVGAANAAPVVTEVNSPGGPPAELLYTPDVSNSDLLHGLSGVDSGSAWSTSSARLNDGVHGLSFADDGTNSITWTTVGAVVTYDLGLGSGEGWDITSIQSIATWQSAGFGNQGWTVATQGVGAGSFTTLATVDYQPLGGGDAGATKVTMTDDGPGGVLASGVQFIRFTANSVNGGANGGRFTFREIDVEGVESGPDENPPTVSALSPVNGAGTVAVGSDLVVSFDEAIAIGSGDVTIVNLDDMSQSTIAITDAMQVSVAGADLIIDPAADLSPLKNYAIRIAPTAIDDTSGNSFAGIANDTTWNFTTAVVDLTKPTISTLSPLDDAVGMLVGTDLVVTFDEPIAVGSGDITIKNLSEGSQTVIPVGDDQVSMAGAVLTIDPSANLGSLKNYAIHIASSAIVDSSGNAFAGIADDTTWNFTTASTPLRIMCLGDSITVGYTDNPGWANHPFMFGYRSGLYTRLTEAGYNFEFVGGSTEPWTGISGDPTHGGTYTPVLDLRDFDQDGHRGYGGAGIWSNVNAWIAADNPDVILLLIGINGISASSPAALNTLVNSIVTTAPDVHLIVAQITPRASFNQNLFDYNVYIRDTLVPTYAGNGHKVSTVDLYSLFLTDSGDYSSAIEPGVLSNNINHPDNPHYDLMAQEWFEGIEATGLVTPFELNASIEGLAPDMIRLRWNSRPGKLYNLRSDTGLTDPKSSWPIFGGAEDLVPTPPENTFDFPYPADPRRFFTVQEIDAP